MTQPAIGSFFMPSGKPVAISKSKNRSLQKKLNTQNANNAKYFYKRVLQTPLISSENILSPKLWLDDLHANIFSAKEKHEERLRDFKKIRGQHLKLVQKFSREAFAYSSYPKGLRGFITFLNPNPEYAKIIKRQKEWENSLEYRKLIGDCQRTTSETLKKAKRLALSADKWESSKNEINEREYRDCQNEFGRARKTHLDCVTQLLESPFNNTFKQDKLSNSKKTKDFLAQIEKSVDTLSSHAILAGSYQSLLEASLLQKKKVFNGLRESYKEYREHTKQRN